MRRHANAEIRNNAERFRYQNLTARYNTMNELWTKQLRAMEEGRPAGPARRARSRPPPPPPPAAGAARRSRVPPRRSTACGSRTRRREVVRALFEQYQQARTPDGRGRP